MPEPPTPAAREAALRGLRREFVDGLPDRLTGLRTALGACADGLEATSVETLYHRAHALKGTAAAYGAHELVEPAARLARLGRSWLERHAMAAGEHAAAVAALDELEAAVQAYRARLEDRAP
jgi:HPt (histidine-containing phosphotransfer) domain-containing protein